MLQTYMALQTLCQGITPTKQQYAEDAGRDVFLSDIHTTLYHSAYCSEQVDPLSYMADEASDPEAPDLPSIPWQQQCFRGTGAA